MYTPDFKFLAQFGGELCEEEIQKIRKMRKTYQKTTSLGLWGGEMELKSRDLLKAHLGSLLNVHTKSQLPNSIWRRDRGGAALLQGQKGGEILVSPLQIYLVGWFFDKLYDLCMIFDQLAGKGANFAILTTQHASPKLGHNCIWIQKNFKKHRHI